MAKSGIIAKLYDLLIVLTSNLRSAFLLAIRCTWGYQFFIDGHGKLTHLDVVTNYFTDLHIALPHQNAILVGATELAGGILLIAGLAGRFWATALTIVMCVAYATGDRDSLQSLDKFVLADPFPYLFASVVVMIFGPGRYSIDFLIQHFVLKQPDDRLPPALPNWLLGRW